MIKKTNKFYTVGNGEIIYEGALPMNAIISNSDDYYMAIVKKNGFVIKLWKYNDGQFKATLSTMKLSEQNPGREVIFTKYSGMKYENKNLLQGISIMKYDKAKKSDNNSEEEILITKQGKFNFKEDDEGEAVLQVHERGLSKDQIDFTTYFGDEPVNLSDNDIETLNGIKKAKWQNLSEMDSDELQEIFKDINIEDLTEAQRKVFVKVDPISIHTDFRLLKLTPDKADSWQGGTGFTPGNQFKENLFVSISKDPDERSKDKIALTFKDESGGNDSMEWMEYGDKEPKIIEPGEPGATKNDYARIYIIDKFKWKAGKQTDKFKEFIFDGKILKGRWIFTLAPEEGDQWLASRPAEQEMKSEIIEKQFKIIKRNDEKRLVYGIIYEPDKKDSDGEEANAEEIEKACHEFMIDYAMYRGSHLDIMHEDSLSMDDAIIVECFIQPNDITLGKQKIFKGSWMIVTKIFNDELWKNIKDGIINGYSMGGTAQS